MKKISYLFLSLAMVIAGGIMLTSCSKEDNPSATSEAEVKARLLGTWYSQYDATGTINDKTYKSVVEVYQFPRGIQRVEPGRLGPLLLRRGR